jgi:hypothetical protein
VAGIDEPPQQGFEAGSQVQASNRCKLLSSKAMVVSVAVNAGAIPGGEVERTVVAYAVKLVDIGCEWPDAHSRDLLQAPDDRVDFRWGEDWNWACKNARGHCSAGGRGCGGTVTIAGRGSNAQCEQFDGGNPKHENCERYRIVFEPNTHDTPHIANRPDANRIADDGYSTICRQNGSLRLRARYRLSALGLEE